ncbi:MAG: hypothetical protein NW215_08805 [Hyphomicrobiales bacterium]|nr:hypothetical protein [Hyphomicrobiales bacterium]
MKSYLLAAAAVLPALLASAPEAEAYGCRGPYCGGGGHYNGYHDYPRELFVNIPTIVSDRPAPGFRTHIHVRAGTRITAVCDRFDWCRILSPRFANLFVPRYCLEPINGYGYSHKPRHFHRNKYFYENGYHGHTRAYKPYDEHARYAKPYNGYHREAEHPGAYEVDLPPHNGYRNGHDGYNGGYRNGRNGYRNGGY